MRNKGISRTHLSTCSVVFEKASCSSRRTKPFDSLKQARKRRFRIVDDLEAKQAREAAALELFADVELDDLPEVSHKVQEIREAYMQEWREYVHFLHNLHPRSDPSCC